MTGKIITQSPINQVITGGTHTDALDSGAGASPNRYKPLRWTFSAGLNPDPGDIITIRTPSAGHDYGIYLSMDSGSHYYPITLTEGQAMFDQYPAGSCITLIFDNLNYANDIYTYNGSDTRQIISGGTWRVINYYDSGAPYGVRVYKQSADLNKELPILVSQLTFNQITDPSMDNVYALMNTDNSKVPTINPHTGVITAAGFNGPMDGTATSAIEFMNPTTVTLTGVVTGVSAPSTRGWTVPTTIENDSVTNEMLYGGIERAKLENGVVKVFTQAETTSIMNLDSIPVNGLFPLRKLIEMPTATGYRPFEYEGAFLSLTTPDNKAYLQLAGTADNQWLIRGSCGNNASLQAVEWRNLVIEDVTGITNRPWSISITGMADGATKDGEGHVISTYYATNTRVNELLAAADALIFKGVLDSSQAYDDDGRKVYRSLPTNGYSAGWTYKVNHDDTYAGYVCEVGDLVIAINDGPVSGVEVRPQDWTVVQANLESAITGTGNLVTPKSFAIFEGSSGKTVRDTGIYLVSLDHTDALAGVNRVGWLDGFAILGQTFTQASDLVSGVANQMAFGDSGPQIQFTDEDVTGAIIYNKHLENSGMTTAFNFVTSNGTVALKADGIIAKQKLVVGELSVDNNNTFKVTGSSVFQGTFVLRDAAAQHSVEISFANNKCEFVTQDELSFGNTAYFGGNLLPSTNNFYTLGRADSENPLTWHAVYIGSSLSYGSNNQPIYWNMGIPTPITYTTNRLYYAPSEGTGFDPGTYYGPTNHYLSSTKLAINYSASEPQEALYVNGDMRVDGSLASRNDILPSETGVSSLGTREKHWLKVYVGENNSYGDPYTPIYWNDGAPAAVHIIQKASFTMNANAHAYNINKAAYSPDTIVIQIVITSGKENLLSPIEWEAGNSQIILRTAQNPRGPVTGYIITARGQDLD